MSKAYKVTKRTVMFDKSNPKTVYSVSPVNYGTLTTDDVANQIAAESSATPGDVKNVLDRFAYYVKENIKKGYQIQLLGFGYLSIRFITTGTAKAEKDATGEFFRHGNPQLFQRHGFWLRIDITTALRGYGLLAQVRGFLFH